MNLQQYDNFKCSDGFYNGYKLLSKMDKNDLKPEIYISASNRSAGKTTFFNGMLLHNYIRKNKKFTLLYRNKYEIPQASSGFFKDINKLFFDGLFMKQEKGVDNVFDILYVGIREPETEEEDNKFIWTECGYVTSLSSSEQIKRYSHLLSDTSILVFDEVFSESGKYLKDEVSRLMSIHDSLARGNGEMVRYLPTLLIGNMIDIVNPYFDALGIIDTLQLESNFVRGDGFVIEQNFNEVSAKLHKESAFHRAFKDINYASASEERKYINTSYNMIDNTICDYGQYIASLYYDNSVYSVRYNWEAHFYYVSNTPDPGVKIKFACTESDITKDAIFDKSNPIHKALRNGYRNNLVRFKNLKCKTAFVEFVK